MTFSKTYYPSYLAPMLPTRAPDSPVMLDTSARLGASSPPPVTIRLGSAGSIRSIARDNSLIGDRLCNEPVFWDDDAPPPTTTTTTTTTAASPERRRSLRGAHDDFGGEAVESEDDVHVEPRFDRHLLRPPPPAAPPPPHRPRRRRRWFARRQPKPTGVDALAEDMFGGSGFRAFQRVASRSTRR